MSIRFVFRKVCSSLTHFFKKHISWFICWWGICLGEGVFLPNPVDEPCTFLGPLWVGVSKFCPPSPLSGLSLAFREDGSTSRSSPSRVAWYFSSCLAFILIPISTGAVSLITSCFSSQGSTGSTGPTSSDLCCTLRDFFGPLYFSFS